MESGAKGKVWTIIGWGNGKTKIAKTSSDSLKNEYETALKYPKNSPGLLIRTKAYVSGAHEMIIMHKYEGEILTIISTMTNSWLRSMLILT